MNPCPISLFFFFFFNDTATTEIYTLSLHDARPIFRSSWGCHSATPATPISERSRSEEHTSELQSQFHLVCRLLLEKKKQITKPDTISKNKIENDVIIPQHI